jgi:GNAT superfamily N-acetyltransferase
MAASDALAIERLGLDDVAGGLALSDAAGWNQTGDDWSFFIATGIAFGVRDDGGTLIATAAALPHDSATGWISMVLVAAAHRHRGIASQLVAACVAALRETGRTPVLDATPAGAAVYARIGFVPGFAFERWEGDGGGPKASQSLGGLNLESIASESSPRATAGAEGSVAGAPQPASVIALDRGAGGVDRAPLLRSFLSRPGTQAWLAPRGDGVAIRRAGRRAAQAGPIVAADDAGALALLSAALDGGPGRVFIDVPGHRTAIAEALTRRGFARQRPFVRMALGDVRAAAARERVFALAGPEFG